MISSLFTGSLNFMQKSILKNKKSQEVQVLDSRNKAISYVLYQFNSTTNNKPLQRDVIKLWN